MSTSKIQFPQGTEVGIEQEDGNPFIAYAILGGVSVSLTKLEDGRLFLNIEGVDENPPDAVMEVDGKDAGTLRFGE